MTPENDGTIDALAARHGVSRAVVLILREAVMHGKGRMAQFNHPEVGGAGQWMAGGMTMIGDMFNQSLRARVAALCDELAAALRATPPPASVASSVWVATEPSTAWWPVDLGRPSQTGGQNALRYAVFPDKRRLATEQAGRVTVYDTQGYVIGGISQQQSDTATVTLSTDRGPVAIDSLPVVPAPPAESAKPAVASEQSAKPAAASKAQAADGVTRPNISKQDLASILRILEQLAELNGKGVLTDAEFDAKKAEVLARL
jgi:hypothetical protein